MTNTNANNLDVIFQDLCEEETASISGGINLGGFDFNRAVPDAAFAIASGQATAQGRNGNGTNTLVLTFSNASDINGLHDSTSQAISASTAG